MDPVARWPNSLENIEDGPTEAPTTVSSVALEPGFADSGYDRGIFMLLAGFQWGFGVYVETMICAYHVAKQECETR